LYEDYAKAGIEEILSNPQRDNAKKLYINHTNSSLLINDNGNFRLKPLPVEAQFSITNSILYKDFDGDNKDDLLIAGNFYPFRVQQGKCDAGIGLLLKGDNRGNFIPVPAKTSGVYITGDVRDMIEVKGRKAARIIVSKNDDRMQELLIN
jgi:hypothetical protein